MTARYGSRFAGSSRRLAILSILTLLGAMIGSVLATPPSVPHKTASTSAAAISPSVTFAPTTKQDEDLALYAAIVRRMSAGEPYYPVAADELRKGVYPLRPFVTFRLPVLATAMAALGTTASRIVLWALGIAVVLAWYRRLDGAFSDDGRRLSGALLIASGLTAVAATEFVVLHEVWAGCLIALSFAVHRSDRWWPSVALGLAAILIRELALPFVLLMAAFAVWRRAWPEVAAWGIAIAIFAAALGLHAQAVATVVTAADPASPGWMTVGGWPAFLRAMAETSALRVFPNAVSAALIVLALFGWLSWRGSAGLFGTLLLAGYALIFMVLGRAQNFYWGLIVSPLLLLGFVFLPQAFRDLRGALLDTGRR